MHSGIILPWSTFKPFDSRVAAATPESGATTVAIHCAMIDGTIAFVLFNDLLLHSMKISGSEVKDLRSLSARVHCESNSKRQGGKDIDLVCNSSSVAEKLGFGGWKQATKQTGKQTINMTRWTRHPSTDEARRTLSE